MLKDARYDNQNMLLYILVTQTINYMKKKFRFKKQKLSLDMEKSKIN